MAERPTGTVTFLFTDVEGSTQLWERHGSWMDAAHQRHEAILRSAIATHGGWAYKQTGDAFQAAFQTASEALAAAIAAQRALAAEPWTAADAGPAPDNRPGDASSARAIRVRMGLHTGTTEERADDYVGPLLNRAARLMSAGHGGRSC
jgi:class 3 adenylate cyclase